MDSSISFEERSRFSKSITLQVALPMVLIGILALTSMLVTIFVTLSSEYDAEAINVAGSMRMQSYRIASLMVPSSGVDESGEQESGKNNFGEALIAEHEQMSGKLYDSSITQVVLGSNDSQLNKAYEQVERRWDESISPLLLSAINQPEIRPDTVQSYLRLVDGYVDDIDKLVLQIQRNSEDKNELMGIFEGLSVFLFFIVMIFIIMRVDQRLVKPLKDLVLAAKRISQGDFSGRIVYEGKDEIGLLSSVFNDMSASLENDYRYLEKQVDERTTDLRRSNQVLDCLYHTAQHLSRRPVGRKAFVDIVTDLKKTTGFEQVAICLTSEPNADKFDLILPEGEEGKKESCLSTDCANCSRKILGGQLSRERGEVTFSIGDQEHSYGFLYIKTGSSARLELWRRRLIEAVIDNISSALSLQEKEGQSRRVILFEERSIIARELHDSLAQSLSYMKMQVSRLSTMLDRKFSEDKLREGLYDLQEGLSSAYKHLRELLDTFRLQLSEPTLLNALEATVEEYGKYEQNIQLSFELGHCPLTPNEDIHILQVVREALSNAVKHADASNIRVSCYQNQAGEAIFQVEDDGVGMPDNPSREHSYGLLTMQERAAVLGGRIDLGPGESGGVLAALVFRPKHSLQLTELKSLN